MDEVNEKDLGHRIYVIENVTEFLGIQFSKEKARMPLTYATYVPLQYREKAAMTQIFVKDGTNWILATNVGIGNPVEGKYIDVFSTKFIDRANPDLMKFLRFMFPQKSELRQFVAPDDGNEGALYAMICSNTLVLNRWVDSTRAFENDVSVKALKDCIDESISQKKLLISPTTFISILKQRSMKTVSSQE